MSKSEQFRLIDMKLPTLADQDIKTQVLETHRKNQSLVLRQPILTSICHILKPTTNFVDSVLLNKNEPENGVELETANVLELKSVLSELDALVGNGCFSTHSLLEREDSDKWIMLVDSMLVKFSIISDLKSLARDDYFMYPALLMEKIANNVAQRFDEINLHMASMDLIEFLSVLSWDIKAVNTMGCFVFKFLEFLGFFLHGPNQPITELAESMASLKEDPVNPADSLLGKFLVPLDQLNNLVKLTLEVIEHISKLTLLSDTEYSKEDLLSSCAYWAILGVVACYIQITLLMQNGEVALELSHLISNLNHILKDLKLQYTICKSQIEEMEAHLQHIAVFGDAFSVKEQVSNTQPKMLELMKSFMYSKDGCSLFIDGSTKSKVDLEVLKEKAIIFLVSDLDIPNRKLTGLLEVYEQLKEENYYEIVWVPFVLKWTEDLRQKFEDLKTKMPWYIMSYNSPISGVWYFKGRKVFFEGNPSYVVIDLLHGNQYPDPNPNVFSYFLDVEEDEHFPFKRIRIASLCRYAAPPILQLLYQEPQQEDDNQKKPSSGFQGLLTKNRSSGPLSNPQQGKSILLKHQ